jgi:hypothetical protein
LAGEIKVKLKIASTGSDADFFVKLMIFILQTKKE